jgi:hypothetical protein
VSLAAVSSSTTDPATTDQQAGDIVVVATKHLGHDLRLLTDTEFAFFESERSVAGWNGDQYHTAVHSYLNRPASTGGLSISNPKSDQTGPIGMGFDYFLGTGDSNRYFGPGSPFSDAFSQGNGAQAFTRFALNKYNSGDHGDGFLLVDNFDYKFTAGRVLSTVNSAEHFVGSWQDGNAYIVGDKIHFVVQNTSGTGSLLYGRPLNDMGLPGLPSWGWGGSAR